MLVLALDTTTRTGSVAVAKDGRVLDLLVGDARRPHAERVPAELVRSLERAGAGLADVDVFAVAVGPGSFTGLRIGIAAIQGCAFASGRPVVGVSALEAIALSVSSGLQPRGGQRLGVWVDAQRQEVYSALYEFTGAAAEPGLAMVEGPMVGPPAETAARWHQLLGGRWCPLAGDGASRYAQSLAQAAGGPVTVIEAPPLAPTIALVAERKARAGESTPPHAIRPLYVRRPDAELARDRQRERA